MTMERYQDFVIKDGRFVGKFEEMYRRFDNPWEQATPEYFELSKSRQATVVNLRKYRIRSAVEFGCGLGFFSDMIRRGSGARVTGIDISPTAIEKAAARFPDIEFKVGTTADIRACHDADAIIFAEISWYILEHLRQAFEDMFMHCHGKFFIHNLVFYQNDAQRYGREYFTDLQQFLVFCPFRLLEYDISVPSDPHATIETCSIFRIVPK